MKRILVVEDEDAIRDFVVINLKRAGYEVVDAPNGEEGVRLFEEANGAVASGNMPPREDVIDDGNV